METERDKLVRLISEIDEAIARQRSVIARLKRSSGAADIANELLVNFMRARSGLIRTLHNLD